MQTTRKEEIQQSKVSTQQLKEELYRQTGNSYKMLQCRIRGGSADDSGSCDNFVTTMQLAEKPRLVQCRTQAFTESKESRYRIA